VSDAGKTVLPTVRADAIFEKQMSPVQSDLDSIAVESHYTMSRDPLLSVGIV